MRFLLSHPTHAAPNFWQLYGTIFEKYLRANWKLRLTFKHCQDLDQLAWKLFQFKICHSSKAGKELIKEFNGLRELQTHKINPSSGTKMLKSPRANGAE